MTKRIISVLFVVMLVFALSGCLKKDEKQEDDAMANENGSIEFDSGDQASDNTNEGDDAFSVPVDDANSTGSNEAYMPEEEIFPSPTPVPVAQEVQEVSSPQSGPSMITVLLIAVLVGGLAVIVFFLVKKKRSTE